MDKSLLWLVWLCVAVPCFGQLQDPTMPSDWRPSVLGESTLKDIHFTGFFNNHDQKTVVINGLSLKEGDFVQGFELIKINSGEIFLKNDHGVFMLPLIAGVKA